jgi:Flp pilus assembly protein TadD
MRRRKLVVLLSFSALPSCVKTVQHPQVAHSYAVNDTMARQVRNATDEGEGDYRIKVLRRRVAANPHDLPARLELAELYREAGFPDIAIEHYRLAASQHPDSASVAIQIAKTLRSMQMSGEARSVLEVFTTSHPKASADASSWLGILRDEALQYENAEADHRAALALAPDNDAFHNNLGYNLLLQKRNTEAAVEFRKALELNPASKTARNNLGLAAPGEALKTWNSGMDAATAHNNLAAVFIEQGDYVAARKEIDSALGYNKDHSAALRNLQLLTELDGGVAQMPQTRKQPDTRWEKFTHTMKVVMVGSGESDDSKQQ